MLRKSGLWCGIIGPLLWLALIAVAFGFTGALYLCFAGALLVAFRGSWIATAASVLIAL